MRWDTDDIRAATKDILRGFARVNAPGLASLLEVNDWKRIARQAMGAQKYCGAPGSLAMLRRPAHT